MKEEKNMKFARVEFSVDRYFKPGDCENCPYYNNIIELCAFSNGWSKDNDIENCPVEVVEYK